MKNIDQPFQNLRKFLFLNADVDVVQDLTIELSQNEFYQDDD